MDTGRKANHPINSLFLNRWSPRAMSGEAVSKDELMSLFEAARWAPSSFNNQHWRFLYAFNGSDQWDAFFNLLMEANQTWAKKAGVLVVILSKKTFDYNGKPANTHSFDAGAAWENFALQGADMDLVVHGMAGFDYEAAAKNLNVPDEYQVEAMAVVGKLGKVEDLPEALRDKEAPSDRKSVSEIAFEGSFPA